MNGLINFATYLESKFFMTKSIFRRKDIIVDGACKLYENLLEIFLDEYNEISANRKEKFDNKCSFDNLALYDYE